MLEPGDARSLALALIGRLRRSGITELRTIGLIGRFGNEECVFEVGLWPMHPDVMEKIASLAAPAKVSFRPHPAPPLRGPRRPSL